MALRTTTLGAALAGLLLLTACPNESPPVACGGKEGCACTDSAGCGADLVCDAKAKTCRAAKDCAALACVAHQECQAPASKQDAVCLAECETGFFWNGARSSCDVVPPNCKVGDPTSIKATCDEQKRDCEELATGGARCGACKAGTVVVGEACEDPVTCAALDCAQWNKVCEELPNGHCTTCLAGFVQDGGSCRKAKTCKEVTCATGEACLEPAEPGIDASCSKNGCGDKAVLGPDGVCHGCPACTDTAKGEAGPYLKEVTGEGRCICTTADGYFWREGLLPGVVPCDADRDGWVRETAKAALESASAAIRDNARCHVRRVDRFVVEAEGGQTLDVMLLPAGTELPLFESERNDDQALVEKAVADGKLPAYGAGGRPLRAEELNPLVKGCIDSQADLNENGLADVNEWHGNGKLDAVLPYLRPYVDFTYFVELYRGWYAPGASASVPGSYRLREKSRDAMAGDVGGVPLSYGTAAGSFWRSCTRFRDAAYVAATTAGTSLQGFDFARLGANKDGWPGLNHHSQFKCLRLVDQRGVADPPNWLTLDLLREPLSTGGYNDLYVPNLCSASGVPAAPPSGVDAVNPSSPKISCGPVAIDTLTNGQVFFGAATYQTYTKDHYSRGCVNECVEFAARCPGYEADPFKNTTECVGDKADFGKLFCGCGYNSGGTWCEHGCPGLVDEAAVVPFGYSYKSATDPGSGVSNLFFQQGYTLTPRQGFWLCGEPAATAYGDWPAPWLGDPSNPNVGFKVEGEVPAMHSVAERLSSDCPTADAGTPAGDAGHCVPGFTVQ